MTLFADDSTVTISSNSTDSLIQYKRDIHNTLTSIIDWLNNNNLKINLDKTKIMHFSQRLTIENMDTNIDNKTVDIVNTTKFLGLIIDKRLDWKSQIENLCKKNCSSAFALHSLAAVVNVDTLIAAYHGLAASHLRYGIIFWGNSTDANTAFKAQKRCIRSMFGLNTVDTCKPYFIRYRLLTLPCLYILETAMFVKTNPNLFPSLQDVVPRNRRDMTILRVYSAKTALMRKSIVCMAPTIFNKLPKRWKELNSKAFKRQLKMFLFKKAYYNVAEFLAEKDFFVD